MINILKQMKNFLVELTIWLFHNMIHCLVTTTKIVGNLAFFLINPFLFYKSIFSGENCIKSPYLLLITKSFSLATSCKNTSSITSIPSLL